MHMGAAGQALASKVTQLGQPDNSCASRVQLVRGRAVHTGCLQRSLDGCWPGACMLGPPQSPRPS